MTAELHPASDREAERIWPVVRRAHLFETFGEYERFRSEAPWRIEVSERGEAVVLDRWRTHLDVLAIRGMWCALDRIPALIGGLAGVARGQRFGRLLSPLVSAEMASHYERSGMEQLVRIVVIKSARGYHGSDVDSPAAGVRLRQASLSDLEALTELDAECFDDFWRYDRDVLAGHFDAGRVVVAERRGTIIGYTLTTMIGGSATLGRIAVHPGHRGHGVGRALLTDALSYSVRSGMDAMTLCTQEENTRSRRLYAAAGMRELPDRLVFLVQDLGRE